MCEGTAALSIPFFIASYLFIGRDVLYKSILNIAHGRVFDENFLMSVATIGALCLGDFAEAVGVMLFYKIGESLSDYAADRAVDSIEALSALKTPHVNLLIDGQLVRTPTEKAKVGDIFVIGPGEQAALDAVVLSGQGFVDTSSITGESVGVLVKPGDTVYAGYIASDVPLTLRAAKAAEDSMIAKIIYLTRDAAKNKAKTEKFITRFARYYTPVVVGLAVCIAVGAPLAGMGSFPFWLRRGLIFLVISCPCALVLSIPLGYFAGIGTASRKGVLIKGSNSLEALAKADAFVFDKTGTLTKGDLAVAEIVTEEPEAFDEYILAAEHYSTHPIAKAFRQAIQSVAIDADAIEAYREVAGSGVELIYKGHDVKAGEAGFVGAEGQGGDIYLTVDGRLLGHAVIGDDMKPDAPEAIARLKRLGIAKTVLLSGDGEDKVKLAQRESGIDIAYGRLDPADKLKKLKELDGEMTVYVGDGINDAPVLAASGVGVAMGALGSDAAVEAADVVIMNDSLTSLVTAYEIARFTKKVIISNIVWILAVKIAFLLAGSLGYIGMGAAVFADVGLAVLSVANVMRIPAFRKSKARDVGPERKLESIGLQR